ncbi:MAG: winged helix-turn-helix domain-containing protein [Candidatus Heteroscillospira sp.]
MVCFIEDDNSIRELVLYALKNSSYEAEGYPDADTFFSALQPARTELILLDVMLPGEDGLSILAKLKANAATAKIPVIMVTALGSEFDKVTALDKGADDYITKPFGMMELLARIRAVLRRVPEERPGDTLSVGGIVIDGDRRVAMVDDREISLTFKEFELLSCLMENRGRVLSRDKLLDKVWGIGCDVETRTVDVHVRTLRQKLGEAGSLVETVRGVGYKIVG